MKNLFPCASALIWAAAIFFSSCTGALSSLEEANLAEGPPPALIPLPKTVEWDNGVYLLPEKNTICYNPGGEKTASWLKELLESTNTQVEITQGTACGNWNIVTDTTLLEQLGEEGYLLDVAQEGVTLKSATEAGLFYAVQTVRQLMPGAIENNSLAGTEVQLREVHVEDVPKYSWRGTMLDVARSFFDLDYLKQHVNRMALYKLNRLHLHLTDDQGWRIEIKSKPALTEIGSKGSVTGGVSGYLTQEEYKELQDYALARNIIIVPEIDMPGHIYSALVAYPELNCDNNANLEPAKATPPALYSGHEVGWSKLCLTKPIVYDFVSTVIGELADITKGPWIHIGGDEIEDPLYKTFVVKADSIVQHYGKTAIGWEEVTQAPVSSSLISQQWTGNTESVVDVKVIQSICSHFYLDHANVPGQENTNNWCKESGVSLEDTYSFRSDNPNVIGVEAALWTEMVHNEETADNRYWPRLVALAEVAWTPESKMDFSNFVTRLSRQSGRLDNMGINYFPTPEVEWGESKVAENPGTVFSGFMP